MVQASIAPGRRPENETMTRNPQPPHPLHEIDVYGLPEADPPPRAMAPPPAPERPHHALDASRTRTIVDVAGVRVGGDEFVLVAGPCSVESHAQVDLVARAVAAGGGRILRGGAFKPRTSPYAFQGLGERGLALLHEAARAHGLAVVTEVMDAEQLDLCARYADLLQVGARNMQNFALLAALGRQERPVLLKRGLSASIDELLWAAEYLLARGNDQVILCERGIRTFETSTRSTLDLSAVPVLRERTHLPVIVDPSHAAGDRRYVPALARAAKAVGADGIMVEIHPEPERALSDGPQALTLPMWQALATQLRGPRAA
jgi:3-deoxy-7-phosphoheptulonate synthase